MFVFDHHRLARPDLDLDQTERVLQVVKREVHRAAFFCRSFAKAGAFFFLKAITEPKALA